MKTFLMLALSLIIYPAWACECKIVYTMEDNYKDAAFVMKVKILSLNDTLQLGMNSKNELVNLHPPFKSGYAPNLKVLKVYKGKLSKKIIPLYGNEYCHEKYTIGKEYVLFIYEGENTYYTRICENNFIASNESSMKHLKLIQSKQ